ncbi:hypothetical protein [Arthrobacter sp. LFS091]|uniref:hypothetical protein n=1 Tax=Arthrobacter sp. LFS091 TaxID=3229892 RepID=UPI003A80BAC8
MSISQIVVAWCAILPIDDLEWRDSVDLVIAELQDEHGRIIRPAGAGDNRIEVQFVCYLASDHEQIVTEQLLANVLTNSSAPSTLVVFACGKRPRGSDIQNTDVRALIIQQASGVSSDVFFNRLRNVDEIKDEARKYLASHIRRNRLSRSVELSSSDIISSSADSVFDDSVLAEDFL